MTLRRWLAWSPVYAAQVAGIIYSVMQWHIR